MTRNGGKQARMRRLAFRFLRNRTGASAVEFALIATPFFFLLLFILQVGIYFMMQISLNNGVLVTAEGLRSAFGTGMTPVLPSGSSLKTTISSGGGALIVSGSNLSVEIQPMSNLNGTVVPVTDGLTNYGSANTVLALRAMYNPPSFMPGFHGLTISSTALVRRQSE